VVPTAPENELVVLPHAMQPVTTRQRRVEPRSVVQLSGRAQIGLHVRHGFGGQVDVSARGIGRQEIDVLGVVVVGVGQEDRVHLPTFTQPGVEAAP
jgi:hypothetical protein